MRAPREQRRGCDEAANRALNRWDAARAKVWRRAQNEDDTRDLQAAFSSIAKHGYGAAKAIERLSFLLPGEEIDALIERADEARILCARAWPRLTSAERERILYA